MILDLNAVDMSLAGLAAHYRRGDFSPTQLCAVIGARAAAEANPIFIHLLSEAELAPYLAALGGEPDPARPLWGVPFAIKDNIDLAGVATTAACPAFAYQPAQSAPAVAALLAAGAIPIGKTNLDQLATGLVGSRSPYGAVQNALNPAYISGGSSSGSAVAVALGLCSFALGTDTAGSGRVPAALNNIFGLKPSRGLISTRGMVPACQSLDCLSIFSHGADDANQVLDLLAGFDPEDPYSRANPYSNSRRYYGISRRRPTFAVPTAANLARMDDAEAAALFAAAVGRASRWANVREVDCTPLLDAAELLYRAPMVAERYLVARALLENTPEALHPVTRAVIANGGPPSAADLAEAQHRLAAYRQLAAPIFADCDALLTPTCGPAFTLEQVAAEPIATNSRLGLFTNFMNLCDLSGVAVPAGRRASGVGFGVTLIQSAFSDKQLLGYAAQWQNQEAAPVGVGFELAPQGGHGAAAFASVELAVCGAHLAGLPLNWQLTERGAELAEVTETAPQYRLYALPGGKKPGLIRRAPGAAIAVEVWRLPASELGSFLAEIPAPLGLGQLELADGRWVTGFVCEPYGLADAQDITELGGWRAYLDS